MVPPETYFRLHFGVSQQSSLGIQFTRHQSSALVDPARHCDNGHRERSSTLSHVSTSQCRVMSNTRCGRTLAHPGRGSEALRGQRQHAHSRSLSAPTEAAESVPPNLDSIRNLMYKPDNRRFKQSRHRYANAPPLNSGTVRQHSSAGLPLSIEREY